MRGATWGQAVQARNAPANRRFNNKNHGWNLCTTAGVPAIGMESYYIWNIEWRAVRFVGLPGAVQVPVIINDQTAISVRPDLDFVSLAVF